MALVVACVAACGGGAAAPSSGAAGAGTGTLPVQSVAGRAGSADLGGRAGSPTPVAVSVNSDGASGMHGGAGSAAVGGSTAGSAGSGGSGGSMTAGSAAGAPSGGSAAPNNAGSGGSTSSATGPSTSSSGTLPAVDDLDKMGPFTPTLLDNTGPSDSYRVFYPKELGQGGIKHPIVLFGQGGGSSDNYATLLHYIASHGFVVLCYWNTPEDKELLDGLDWLIAQNKAESGMLAGKLDVEHVAGAGHSYGSLGIFNIAGDPRFTTTVHLSGGTLDPHAEVANLRAPAAFICGQSPMGDDDGTWTGDMANPNCAADFDKATVPVFYGSLAGAAHIQFTDAVENADDPLRRKMIGAVIGWLRWKLAGDESQKPRYVGTDCTLCAPGTGWTVMQKGLM